MTAEEKRQAFDDALFLKVNAMNGQFLQVLHEINESLQQLRAEMRHEFAEVRAEQRAGREALLQILDRLPPPPDAPPNPG